MVLSQNWKKKLLASSLLPVHPSAWTNLAATGQIFVKFCMGCFAKNSYVLLYSWTCGLRLSLPYLVKVSTYHRKFGQTWDNKFYKLWSNNIWTKAVYCNIYPMGILYLHTPLMMVWSYWNNVICVYVSY